MIPDFEHCFSAVKSKDARFDGVFFTAVTSTGIYCRPSCPAITPNEANVRFFPTAAAAQEAGFRACKRCRPDASPGSPDWNVRGDVVGRTMLLIADGVVEREGVAGLARRVHLGERQLLRLLRAEVGAGPRALAKAQRTQTARVLIESTDLRFGTIAFASGFKSIRQFNDSIKGVFACTPTELRCKSRSRGASVSPGAISLRLPFRTPFDPYVLDFCSRRLVRGIEESVGGIYRRTLKLPHGPGVAEVSLGDDGVHCTLRLKDVRDLQTAVQRCRRMLDLDADSQAIGEHLERDPALAPLVRARPGVRIPGTINGEELAMRAILGQQISVAGALTLAARLVTEYGKPLTAPDGGLTHVWPDAGTIAEASLDGIVMPKARKQALRGVATALDTGAITLSPSADREETYRKLTALPGIGPWTASYISMRALGDPDAFLPTDLGVLKGLSAIGRDSSPKTALAIAERWRPWRSYALQYLWTLVE